MALFYNIGIDFCLFLSVNISFSFHFSLKYPLPYPWERLFYENVHLMYLVVEQMLSYLVMKFCLE